MTENSKPGSGKTPDGPTARTPDDRPGAPPPRRATSVWRVVAVLAVLAIGGGAGWWYATRNEVSTDDAYTDGRAITIAPKVAGYVTELLVTDNQLVHAGDVLLRIDPRDYIAARDQAAGRVASVEAQLANARLALDLARVTYPARLASAQAQRDAAQAVLIRAAGRFAPPAGPAARRPPPRRTSTRRPPATPQARAQLAEAEAALRQAEPVAQNIAQAEAQVHELEGELAQAQAQLDQAEVNLSYCTLTAPQDGWVTKRNVERGSFVNAGGVADVAGLARGVGDRQLQGNPARPHAARASRCDISVDAYPGAASCAAMWTASRKAPADASRPSRRRTPPAISSRSCSACR